MPGSRARCERWPRTCLPKTLIGYVSKCGCVWVCVGVCGCVGWGNICPFLSEQTLSTKSRAGPALSWRG